MSALIELLLDCFVPRLLQLVHGRNRAPKAHVRTELRTFRS